MPNYWGKNYFAHGSFPKMGQKQKTEKIISLNISSSYEGGNYFAHGSFPEVGQKQKTEKKRKKEKKVKNRSKISFFS